MLLAIDTSQREHWLCLVVEGGARHVWCQEHPRGGLAGRIAALLHEAHGSPRDLRAIAPVVGPGSFTGLRVGVSAAVGMAIGLGCPVVPLPALEVAAARVADASPVLVLRAAGRGEVFAARYDAALRSRVQEPWHGALSQLPASWWHPPVSVLLEAPDAERRRLQVVLPAGVALLEEQALRPRADALAARASARLDLGEVVGYDEIRLLYAQRPSTGVPGS